MENTYSKRKMLTVLIWCLTYFRPYLLQVLLYILCGGVMIFCELYIPRKMSTMVDTVLPMGDMLELRKSMYLLILIVLIFLFIKGSYRKLELIIANKILKNQQVDLINQLYRLGYPYYDKISVGKLLSLFENSVNQTQQIYNFLFPQFIYSFAQFIVPSWILIRNQPMYFFIAMVGNVIYVVMNQFTNYKIKEYLTEELNLANRFGQVFYDTIEGIGEHKALGTKGYAINQSMNSFSDFTKVRMKSIIWRHIRFSTVGLTLSISMVLFYIYGFHQIQAGDLLVGELIGYSFFMGLMSRGFSVFFYIIPALHNALIYGNELYDFMRLHPFEGNMNLEELMYNKVESVLRDNEENDFKYDIEFKNISFSYEDGNQIIDNLTLSIPYGKKIAIVGESGCGKSTLIKLLSRLYLVDSGVINIGNRDIMEIPLFELRSMFGHVYQESYLFHLSIKDNIRFGNIKATDEDIRNAAIIAKAHEFILNMEHGYDTILQERGEKLSGGQKQRIAVARMILNSPKIILLDEATSALDRQTEKEIKESLDTFAKGKTVIAIAHRLSTIQDYDEIIVLEKGKICESGTYDTLMKQKGRFFTMVYAGDNND